MLPTQRTALVEMTRWSMSIIASAPEAQRALTTAWTSCWCTTMSSTVKPLGIWSPRSLESLSETSIPGPTTGVRPAPGARASARLVRSSTAALPLAASPVRASTCACRASRVRVWSSLMRVPDRMRSAMESESERMDPLVAVLLLAAKSRPATRPITGTRIVQMLTRGRRGDAAWLCLANIPPVPILTCVCLTLGHTSNR